MKLNKRVLKDIVKECLVEILAEGLVQNNSTASEKRASLHESIRQTANVSQQRRKTSHSNKHGYLDNISFGKKKYLSIMDNHLVYCHLFIKYEWNFFG